MIDICHHGSMIKFLQVGSFILYTSYDILLSLYILCVILLQRPYIIAKLLKFLLAENLPPVTLDVLSMNRRKCKFFLYSLIDAIFFFIVIICFGG